jgi:hypothetical protein
MVLSCRLPERIGDRLWLGLLRDRLNDIDVLGTQVYVVAVEVRADN